MNSIYMYVCMYTALCLQNQQAGAEEAFKILGQAVEYIGTQVRVTSCCSSRMSGDILKCLAS